MAERRFAGPMSRTGPLVPDARRTYQIMSLANGKSLEVEGSSKENGARIRPADWTGEPNQAWRFVPLVAGDAGLFQIVSVATRKCLTMENGNASDGTRLIQSEWGAKNYQKWRLVRDAEGELWIEAKHSRKVLGIPATAAARGRAAGAAGRAGGPAVEQATDRSLSSQRWRLLPAD
jgi:mannan endo-1,4-beta-mannosidase